jgi:CheY-like chemotaxis protein
MLTDLMGGELTVTSTPGQGSVFRVRLFLPEVHGAGPAPCRPAAQRAVRRGYRARGAHPGGGQRRGRPRPAGALLEPLGFELRTAASGHDCLDLLAAGYRPDVMLMDLAMPGIDGWETIRRMRAARGPGCRPTRRWPSCRPMRLTGLDNDVGIRPEDFSQAGAPQRAAGLAGAAAGLRWLRAGCSRCPAPPADAPSDDALPVPAAWPSRAELAALAQVVQLGYYRGILNQLDEIERGQPGVCPLCRRMRELAQQFQFEAMRAGRWGRRP